MTPCLVLDASTLVAFWGQPAPPAAPRTRLFAAIEQGRIAARLSAGTLAAAPVPWLARGDEAILPLVDRFVAEFPHLTVEPVTPAIARRAARWVAAGVTDWPLVWALATAEQVDAAGVVVEHRPTLAAHGPRLATPAEWIATWPDRFPDEEALADDGSA